VSTPQSPSQESPKLVLHVGSPKTGTSFVQSSLAISRNSLSASGIWYPEHSSDRAAVAGYITSGNIDAFDVLHMRDDFLRGFDDLPPSMNKLLYSNENMIQMLSEAPHVLSDVLAVAPVEALAFVRDPVEWLWSTYGQHVKGRGVTHDLEEFVPRWRHPHVALEFFKMCDEMGIGLTVRNYSRVRPRLLDVFEQMLSPQGDVSLTRPERETVNRSLTLSELALQRVVNGSDFASPVTLAYSLVDQLPGVAIAPRPVSARLLDLIEENFSAVFAELATYLPKDEAPRFPTPNDTTGGSPQGDSADSSGDSYPYSFSQSQIEVIVGTLVSAPLPDQTATLLSAENGRLTARMSELESQLDALTTSRSWRYTRILRASLRVWRGRNRRSEP
jgi:hypothetical protein